MTPCASPNFIDRPILATVLSVFLTLIGLGALVDPAGRAISGDRAADGAGHHDLSRRLRRGGRRTVATPLEQEINGVENMLYMSSQSTGDGKLTITVTFRIGTDLNVAQMLTQNRVQDALPRLPEDVQRLGVQVRKATPNILLAVHLYSPDKSRDTLYLSNYATLHVKDALARLPGRRRRAVLRRAANMRCASGSIPDKVAAYNLNAERSARRAARAERAGLGGHPEPAAGRRRRRPIRSTSQTLGRLSTPEQFADIVLKSDSRGTRDAPPRHRPGRGRRRRLRLAPPTWTAATACRC